MEQKDPLRLINGYPEDLIEQVRPILEAGKLEEVILKKYPNRNSYTTDKALYELVQELKRKYLKKAKPITKVVFDKKMTLEHHALGLHSSVSRIQGNKLKSKNEIRISQYLREAPEELFMSIVVHELAHIKEKDHDKAFYSLCQYMLGDYGQLEFDMRLYIASQEFKKINKD